MNVHSATSLPVQKLVWPTEEVTLKTLHDELSTASRKVRLKFLRRKSIFLEYYESYYRNLALTD